MNNFNFTRLEFARMRRGYTAKKVADTLGIKIHTYRRYEKGDKEPDDNTIDKFSNMLDFPRKWFFAEDIYPIDIKKTSIPH